MACVVPCTIVAAAIRNTKEDTTTTTGVLRITRRLALVFQDGFRSIGADNGISTVAHVGVLRVDTDRADVGCSGYRTSAGEVVEIHFGFEAFAFIAIRGRAFTIGDERTSVVFARFGFVEGNLLQGDCAVFTFITHIHKKGVVVADGVEVEKRFYRILILRLSITAPIPKRRWIIPPTAKRSRKRSLPEKWKRVSSSAARASGSL